MASRHKEVPDYRATETRNGSVDGTTSKSDDSTGTYTVEQAVEHIGFGVFQVRCLLICGLFTATDAIEMMLIAVLSPALRCEWYLSEWQIALVSTFIFIGMAAGCTFWGALADRYGRLSITYLCGFLLTWYGVITAFSPSIIWVMITRCLVGWAFGGALQRFTLLSEYIPSKYRAIYFSFTLLSEYIPSKYRAKLLVVTAVCWSTGSLFEVFLAALIMPTLGWRYLVAISVTPSFISLFFLYFLPESARFLVAAGRRGDARKVLLEAAEINGTTLPEGVLVQESKEARGRCRDIFNEKYRRTTLIMWMMWFGASFMAYGVLLINSEFLEQGNFCGTDGKRDLDSFETCHCDLHTGTDYISMAVSTAGEFLVLPINMLAVDTIGRRRTILLNYTMAGVLFLFLNICTGLVGYTIIIFIIRAFTSAIFNICYIYTAEVFPTTIRSLSLGTCSTWARVGSMVTPFLAQVLVRSSPTIAINVYACFSMVFGLISLGLTIETKGREMKQGVVDGR